MHHELSEEEKFYRNALTRMPDGPVALEESYSAVMGIVSEVEQYVKVGPLLRLDSSLNTGSAGEGMERFARVVTV